MLGPVATAPRPLREFGLDPDDAGVRPPGIVEGYQQ